MTSRKAFTLIELLVVIAIIAILAAILFPVFAQAKLAAKKTTAVSNLKQINLGLMMYENDYDDMTPNMWAIGIPQPYTIPDELAPYIQKVNNQAAGNNQGNDSGIWGDPGETVSPKNDGSVLSTTTAKLAIQSFVPIYSTSGNGALYGGGVSPDLSGISGSQYTPGFSASLYQRPANCFTFVQTANESSILGSVFNGVKRPVDALNPGLPAAVFKNVTPNPAGVYGGQDCIANGNINAPCSAFVQTSGQSVGALWYGTQEVYAYADGHVKTSNPFQTIGTGDGTGINPHDGRICDIIYPCGGWIAEGQ